MPAMKLNQSHAHGKLMFFFESELIQIQLSCVNEEREKKMENIHIIENYQ